jgi:rhodanese-related sulfurtransferase
VIIAERSFTEIKDRRRTIDQVLESARRRLRRFTAAEAEQAWREGAVLVDIRPAAQRKSEGELPGAMIIERNVLEWRFDPSSDARLSIADYDLQVIVLCQEGYTSSLAAASLQDIGIHKATDVIGGYAVWRELLYVSRGGDVSPQSRQEVPTVAARRGRFAAHARKRSAVQGATGSGKIAGV